MKKTACLIVITALISAYFPAITAQEALFDILIRNGRVVDGTGALRYRADVGIRQGRIAALGRLKDAQATKTIDADGLVVALGFVDMMMPSAAFFAGSQRRGVQSADAGHHHHQLRRRRFGCAAGRRGSRARGWRTMREFFAKLEQRGMLINMVQTVGYTQLRRLVIGLEDKRAPRLNNWKKCARWYAKRWKQQARLGFQLADLSSCRFRAGRRNHRTRQSRGRIRRAVLHAHAHEGDQPLEAIRVAHQQSRQHAGSYLPFENRWARQSGARWIWRSPASKPRGLLGRKSARTCIHINNGLAFAR
ncbi:MAG: hypothetical protein U0X75_01270 [Acidobacteriota bacterium]